MNKTPNYQLNQWDALDKVQRTDFNADNAKIDAALGALTADKAGRTALEAETAARVSAVASLTSQLAQRGNCQIVTGSYTGTGKVGKNYPNSLSFNKKPVLVLISGDGLAVISWGSEYGYILQKGTGEHFTVVWSQNSVSWYCGIIEASPYQQMNESGRRYNYVAFLSI